MRKVDIDTALKILGGVTVVLIIYGFVWLNNTIDVNNPDNAPKSSLAGLACANAATRPIAVMLASDPEARPLTGIGQADMVIEMPVTPNGITRLMAVFQCNQPTEIGSIRSAREDFLPLAAGLDVIYAHWGGEHNALAQLNQNIMDNINGLIYDGTLFYRKKDIRPPHNGFTSFTNLKKIIDQLKYSTENTFVGYPHKDKLTTRSLANVVETIAIPYSGEYAVSWTYDKATNTYLRTRNSRPEIDKNTGQQVRASVIVLMETSSTPIDYQYINVRTKGTGYARIFQDGTAMDGTWNKDSATLDSKLLFNDTQGKEIPFTPGSIWVEIVTGSTQ